MSNATPKKPRIAKARLEAIGTLMNAGFDDLDVWKMTTSATLEEVKSVRAWRDSLPVPDPVPYIPRDEDSSHGETVRGVLKG